MGTKIQAHLLFGLQCCLKYHFNFVLVVCQRRSPIKEMKRKSVNGTFHEELPDNKAACVLTQKVERCWALLCLSAWLLRAGEREQNLQGCYSLKCYTHCWWAREGNKDSHSK